MRFAQYKERNSGLRSSTIRLRILQLQTPVFTRRRSKWLNGAEAELSVTFCPPQRQRQRAKMVRYPAVGGGVSFGHCILHIQNAINFTFCRCRLAHGAAGYDNGGRHRWPHLTGWVFYFWLIFGKLCNFKI